MANFKKGANGVSGPAAALHVSPYAKQYSSFATAIDLVAVRGHVARRIQITAAGSGNLSVVCATGETEAFTVATGDVLDLGIRQINSATNITRCIVFW